MKSIEVRYSDDFPTSPMTGWTGVRYGVWISDRTVSGQRRKAQWRRAPFYSSRKRWAELHAHLDGIDMQFATPQELDHFIDVMSRNPLPKGANLFPGFRRPGLPNKHWLSRFPARGKSRKFRDKAIAFLTSKEPALTEFRAFYKGTDYTELAGFADRTNLSGSGTYQQPFEVRQ